MRAAPPRPENYISVAKENHQFKFKTEAQQKNREINVQAYEKVRNFSKDSGQENQNAANILQN